MKFSALRAAIALAAASALSLVGCGGGGGSSASNPVSNINSAIKLSNSKDVGSQSYWAIDFLNGQINSSVIAVANATDADLSATNCKFGGSSTRSGVNTDTVTLVDTNCDNGVWVSNGTTTIKLSNLTGNPFKDPAWKGTLTITFDFHSSFGSDFTAAETGDLIVDYTQTAPNVGTYQARNNSLLWRLTSGSLVLERTITKLLYTGAIDLASVNTFATSFTLSGKLGKLGSVSYDVATMTDFKRQISSSQAAGKPSQGKMTVTASDKSALIFTAVDTSTVQLQVDRNGDNVIDESTTASWDELSSLFYQFN